MMWSSSLLALLLLRPTLLSLFLLVDGLGWSLRSDTGTCVGVGLGGCGWVVNSSGIVHLVYSSFEFRILPLALPITMATWTCLLRAVLCF